MKSLWNIAGLFTLYLASASASVVIIWLLLRTFFPGLME